MGSSEEVGVGGATLRGGIGTDKDSSSSTSTSSLSSTTAGTREEDDECPLVVADVLNRPDTRIPAPPIIPLRLDLVPGIIVRVYFNPVAPGNLSSSDAGPVSVSVALVPPILPVTVAVAPLLGTLSSSRIGVPPTSYAPIPSSKRLYKRRIIGKRRGRLRRIRCLDFRPFIKRERRGTGQS